MIDVLSDLFILRGVPELDPTTNRSLSPRRCKIGSRASVRGPRLHRSWQSSENSFIGSFSARFRDELLSADIFFILKEANVVIESWRRNCNTERPRGSLGIQAASARSVHPRLRRVDGFAIPASCAARASGAANHELTFEMDQSTGG